jgi:hypothetical protein
MRPFLRQLWEEQAEQLELPFTPTEQLIVQSELFVCV